MTPATASPQSSEGSAKASRYIVLGAGGWLGRAILGALSRHVPATGLGRAQLAGRTSEEVRDLLAPDEALVVVNAVGRLRGSTEELAPPNLEFVQGLARALHGSGAHVVHIGSAAEYGNQGETPIRESAPLVPATPYGKLKAQASMLVLEANLGCVLRPFNVVDVDMVPENPVARMRDGLRRGGVLQLPAAWARRDHISRTFVAESVSWAARARTEGVFNLASGVGLTYQSIALAMAARLDIDVTIDDQDLPGIRTVIGDPSNWAQETGLAEAMDASALADLTLGLPVG